MIVAMIEDELDILIHTHLFDLNCSTILLPILLALNNTTTNQLTTFNCCIGGVSALFRPSLFQSVSSRLICLSVQPSVRQAADQRPDWINTRMCVFCHTALFRPGREVHREIDGKDQMPYPSIT